MRCREKRSCKVVGHGAYSVVFSLQCPDQTVSLHLVAYTDLELESSVIGSFLVLWVMSFQDVPAGRQSIFNVP